MTLTHNKKRGSEDSLISENNFRKRKKEDLEELPMQKYQEDRDFDEAFKNLLRPIELIAKTNHYDYNLIKELDSYLYHLRELREEDNVDFVEAALMFQNIILIYQKRVDHLVDFMMKLVRKFRAYRVHQNDGENNGDDDAENVECNKKKKKEKKIKYYPTFEPIKGQIIGTLKNFDCKIINLTKLPAIPKIVLNANIKVDNKYSNILPYICIGNGENIGKKYDYMINYCLNRDLAVNQEFDCVTNGDQENIPPLQFCESTDPLPINVSGMDHKPYDPPSITPEPVIFDQTFSDEICVANAISLNPANILNVSQIPERKKMDIDAWDSVNDTKSDIYSDKPITKKKGSKKIDNDNGIWLPTYVVSELFMEMFKLKTGLGVDPAFRKLVADAQNQQRSDIAKKKLKHIKDSKEQLTEEINEEFDEDLLNGGFDGFNDMIDNGDAHSEEPDIGEQEVAVEDFQTYKKNMEDMRKHEQNQIELMNEQLEMRKRVQAWHDNLRPILEDEERRTAFDIHDYGTKVLNCFNTKGEKKSFEQLVSGQKQGEVARFFLSSLMLANTYNLCITKPTDDPLTVGIMNIELLKKERHHEELQINIGNQVNHE
ncbi:condensin-2 complex subunit H2 isoform X2 [Daktulosphaira vitifoliae]|uniref:condensin-2 complex subunit H2 isoform X2 n=1 Tax=Daktulosphaira vitifoliae TaxID=58002 RepID=UPI0021AA1F63|nr:condensin-2 complex subunit H2 isoform X2 [Daktulosphaira vitifoliae]